MNYVDHTDKSPVVLSFCPGILGLERGIARAIGGVRVAAYVEIEAFCIANLVAGMEAGVLDPAPIWTNAKTFDARPFRGKVHGIIGGYPCQPFSQSGLQKGEKDPRHLWPHIESAMVAARPVWAFFENVPGHLTCGFETVRNSLQGMGYRVEAGIYSAREVGAPHERRRLFILAILADTIGQRGQLPVEREFPAKQFAGWPAPKGSPQHEWEEPRTIEPGVGSSVNGYDCRNDLLRALGNSVVEQTAEIAFLDLLRKHSTD